MRHLCTNNSVLQSIDAGLCMHSSNVAVSDVVGLCTFRDRVLRVVAADTVLKSKSVMSVDCTLFVMCVVARVVQRSQRDHASVIRASADQ